MYFSAPAKFVKLVTSIPKVDFEGLISDFNSGWSILNADGRGYVLISEAFFVDDGIEVGSLANPAISDQNDCI